MEVKRRGGGLYTLMPSELAKFLRVGEGDRIVYVKDLENKTVLILTPERVKVMIEGVGPAGIPFSIPRRILRKMASKSSQGQVHAR